MGEHFSSSSRDLVGSFLHTWQNILHILIMKFFAIIAFVGYTQAFLVRREAAPEADADAEPGYGYGAVSPAAVSAPVCNSVPEKVCKDRTIETPRKVCHTEHDEIVDSRVGPEAVVATHGTVAVGVAAAPAVAVAAAPVVYWRSCLCLWCCCCPPCCWICWHRSRTCWICWILNVLIPHFLYFTLSHTPNRISLILYVLK